MHKKSIPLDRSMWKFVMRASLGEIDTYLWHRQGSNQFCWRPIGKPWGAATTTMDETYEGRNQHCPSKEKKSTERKPFQEPW
jgi:hypothetical protein